jgi:hypothetical protein
MRLQYHIQVFIAHGMHVILDYQPMNTEPQAFTEWHQRALMASTSSSASGVQQ